MSGKVRPERRRCIVAIAHEYAAEPVVGMPGGFELAGATITVSGLASLS